MRYIRHFIKQLPWCHIRAACIWWSEQILHVHLPEDGAAVPIFSGQIDERVDELEGLWGLYLVR